VGRDGFAEASFERPLADALDVEAQPAQELGQVLA
jgi:hypothetical protein